MFTVNQNPTPRVLRRFALASFIGFSVLGTVAWCWPWLKAGEGALLSWRASRTQVAAVIAWVLGLALGVVGFAPRSLARPVYVGWMTAVSTLGIVVSTILLTMLFVVVLPVFSVVVRLGDPLRRKRSAHGTYWEDTAPQEATIERMTRRF